MSFSGPIDPSPKKPSSKASSPGLEYLDKYTQQVHDTCPLRYTNSEVINQWMKKQVPYKVIIGKAPLDLSDEATGWEKMGLGLLSEEGRLAQALLKEEDAMIEGLIMAHSKPPVRH